MDHHVANGLGAAFAQLGQKHEAVAWLRKAAETGFPCHPWYARDPLLAPLRGDVGFEDFLERQERALRVVRGRYSKDN